MAHKRSKNFRYEKDFYFTIISYVKDHQKLPDLPISKQARNYYVSKLKRDKILIKRGYGVWVVDLKRYNELKVKKEVKISGNDTKNIRGHGFHFRLRIPKISNWHKREEYLIKKGLKFKRSNAIWKGQRLIIKGCKVWLCSKSIIVYYPKGKSFYGYSAKETKEYALYHLEQIIRSLEGILKVDLKYNGKHQYKVSKQHYGKIKDSLAHQYNKEGKKIKCYLNQENWLVIDHSLNQDELETLHPISADHDQDKVIIPFLNDLKDHYDKTGESFTMGGMLKVIQEQNNLINSLINGSYVDRINKKDGEDKSLQNYFG